MTSRYSHPTHEGRPSVRAAFVDLKTTTAAYRRIPDPTPLAAVSEVQTIVVARLDAQEAFAAALTRWGIPTKRAERTAAWLGELLTPSGRNDLSERCHP